MRTEEQVTLWYKRILDSDTLDYKYEFNHIQNGHADNDVPIPFKLEFKAQNDWKSYVWMKELTYVINGVVKTNEILVQLHGYSDEINRQISTLEKLPAESITQKEIDTLSYVLKRLVSITVKESNKQAN